MLEFNNLLYRDLLLYLFSFLSPEELWAKAIVNRNFKTICRDNSIWRMKFKRHFPHVFKTLVNQAGIDWYQKFREVYKQEYKKLSKRDKKIFSSVKESDVASLKAIKLTFLELCLSDKNTLDLVNWATIADHQDVLDYFYQLAVIEFSKNSNIDINKRDKNGRTILHWTVLCRQTVATIDALIKKGAVADQAASSRTPLSFAAENGNTKVAELLIKLGVNINARSTRGATSLIFAIENQHRDMVKLLLSHHADTSIPLQSDGSYHEFFKVRANDTPLHVAAIIGHVGIVEDLLAANVVIDAASSNRTPLSYAAEEGHEEIAALLIKSGANLNSRSNAGATPLLFAVEHQRQGMVELLLSKKADVTIPLQNNVDYHNKLGVYAGDTPLHVAARRGHVGIAELLINNGADVNSRNVTGATPLLLACQNGHESLVALFLKHRADTSIAFLHDGDTPLHAAVRAGHIGVVKLLLQSKVVIDALIGSSRTPLSVAVEIGRLEIAELLIAQGANVNTCSYAGATPLMFAVEYKHENLAQLLLKNGGDTSIPLRDSTDYHAKFMVVAGDTPLYAAVKSGQYGMVKTLLDGGAEIRASLLLAAKHGDINIFDLLLLRGADLQSHDGNGKTALYYATHARHKKIVQLLLINGLRSGMLIQPPITTDRWVEKLNVELELFEKLAEIRFFNLGIEGEAKNFFQEKLILEDKVSKASKKLIEAIQKIQKHPNTVAQLQGQCEILSSVTQHYQISHENVEKINLLANEFSESPGNPIACFFQSQKYPVAELKKLAHAMSKLADYWNKHRIAYVPLPRHVVRRRFI